MSGYKGRLHFNLWWGSPEKTVKNIEQETRKLQIAFSASQGSTMAPYDGDVSFSIPEQLQDEQVHGVLGKVYPGKEVIKENNRFKLEF